MAAKRKPKFREERFVVGQVVCVYADATHYYESVEYAGWCGREYVYLTSGGHTSNLYNMRSLTARERGERRKP